MLHSGRSPILFLGLLGVLVLFPSLIGAAEPPSDLAEYQWKNRLLLVFTPNLEHQQWQAQQQEVQKHEEGFAERDLLLVSVVGKPDHPLRKRFDVPLTGFAALLVGKDGEVKARKDGSLTAAELFGRIDSMPMRIREMRE